MLLRAWDWYDNPVYLATVLAEAQPVAVVEEDGVVVAQLGECWEVAEEGDELTGNVFGCVMLDGDGTNLHPNRVADYT